MKSYYQHTNLLTVVSLLLIFSACQTKESTYTKIEPAHLEKVEGNEDLHTVTLTEKAVERINIKTDLVSEEAISATNTTQRKTVPYGAVLYDANGKTWVYKNPKPLLYMRHEIVIDLIDGERAYLLEGPPVGTAIVVQGASELYGTEYEVGH